MQDPELIDRCTAILDAQAAAGQFSGSALLARGSRVLFHAARGYAIQPAVQPNQPGTRFNIASATKMFTAVAVMQLAAAGKFDLHAPVAAVDPDLPYADRITIYQLLTHTAGFSRYWNEAYRAARSDLRSIRDYIQLFASLPLEFEPGTRHLYGNSGYVLLSALIERVTSLSYYDAIRQTIFDPLGMLDSGYFELDLPVENCAVGYTRENWFGPVDGQLRNNLFIYAVKGSPSEHCFSTTQDLFRFCQALQAHQLLDAAHTELCFTPHVKAEQPGVSYGYGCHIIDDGKTGRIIGHGGRALGADAFALMYRNLGYTLIVLSNYDRPAARQLVNALQDLLIA